MFLMLTSTHEVCLSGKDEHIRYVEAELARVKQENRELVNALAVQARVPPPFVTNVPVTKGVIKPRKSVFQRTKELERDSKGAQ